MGTVTTRAGSMTPAARKARRTASETAIIADSRAKNGRLSAGAPIGRSKWRVPTQRTAAPAAVDAPASAAAAAAR